MAIFNSTAPCPYCYTEINPRKLAYRCSGRNHPDRQPCAKAPDATRQRHFGDSDPYWPVIAPVGSSSGSCPGCGSAPGSAICPACHSRLPLEFSSANLQVGVMGEYNSGKSTYLAALDGEIQKLASRLGASCRHGDGDGNRDLQRYWSEIERNGHLPPQTQRINGLGQPAIYSWRSTDGRRVKGALISFTDHSGSDFLQGQPLDGNGAFGYLARSTAILLVLDPFNFPANAGSRGVRGLREPHPDGASERIVQNAAIAIRQARGIKPTKAIPVPLACFVAKMDAFSDEGSRYGAASGVERIPYSSSQIRTRLGAWGADSLVQVVETEFARVRYFGGSALGSEPDYANARVPEKKAQPAGVADPLLWFMAEKGIVRSNRMDQSFKERA